MTLKLKMFLVEQPWISLLSEHEQEQVMAEIYERRVMASGYVCRAGDPAEHWVGVITGLLKASVMSAQGKTTTYAGISEGEWLGEGSVLKGGIRRYDVIALRESSVVCVPRATFLRLYSSNLRFCHFLIDQLNSRLAQQMETREFDRLLDPETRVARFLAMLLNGRSLQRCPSIAISQNELAQLCGLSRQFVNRAFMKLDALGIISHQYGRLTILDVKRLQNFKAEAGGDVAGIVPAFQSAA